MSLATYIERMKELSTAPSPPNFAGILARCDKELEELLPGQWLYIYDHPYPQTLLYAAYGLAESEDIEFSPDGLKLRKIKKSPYNKDRNEFEE